MYKIIGADGKEYGPVSLDELKSWVRDNRANGETLVQSQGTSDWRPLKTCPEFSDVLGASNIAAPPPPAPGFPQPQPDYGAAANIPNYLIPAIFATLCCCLPGGIASIIYSVQANGKKDAGDIPGAMAAAGKAKMWFWISLVVGGLFSVLYVIFMLTFSRTTHTSL